MLIFSVAPLVFILFVFFRVRLRAVLFISFLAGRLVTPRYLLFGARWAVYALDAKRIGAGFTRLLTEPVVEGIGDDSPKRDSIFFSFPVYCAKAKPILH